MLNPTDHSGLVYKLCLSYATKLRVAIEDLFQDCMLNLVARCHKYDSAKGAQSTFVQRVTVNCLETKRLFLTRACRKVDSMTVNGDYEYATSGTEYSEDAEALRDLALTLPSTHLRKAYRDLAAQIGEARVSAALEEIKEKSRRRGRITVYSICEK